MKNFLLYLILPILFNCSNVQENEISSFIPLDRIGNPITEIKFDYYEFDAGEVDEGTVVTYQFPFTNTGENPLIIANCKSSCGCVVLKWPRDPIPPNDTGIIEAKFTTKGRKGKQVKSITLITNTEPEVTMLRLRATVIRDEE